MHRLVPLLALCAACVEEPGVVDEGCVGLDLDGDGVCDRERADWSRDAVVEPGQPRHDVYGLGDDLPEIRWEGYGHAVSWPVEVTGLLLPWGVMEATLDPSQGGPELETLRAFAELTVGFGTLDGLWSWMGLPERNEGLTGPTWEVPAAAGLPDDIPLGAGLVETEHGPGLTFACFTCHAGRFQGRTVVGLANRLPRANEAFVIGFELLQGVDDQVLRDVIGATDDDLALMARTRAAIPAVGTKTPEVRGLDTSLAQVARSLARREADAHASFSDVFAAAPRPHALDEATGLVADSKPMPWFTMKHKTRWLADGSIVSGNPVFTNFLWNELGRGTDLEALEAWMRREGRAIDALTAAVFATEAPRWIDFFPEDTLDLEAARRGEVAFEARCARCHGSYVKDWEAADPFATVEVRYPSPTPVIDVGTDPQRAEGMAAFADRLNDLAISQWADTVVEVQEGYVPPPLDAVWARYPYLHNNSVPTLCDLLSPVSARATTFVQGPSEQPEDFDADCVGYPTGEAIPEAWFDDGDAVFDVARPGLSNAGHTEMIDGSDGNPPLGEAERADLIAFLKTL